MEDTQMDFDKYELANQFRLAPTQFEEIKKHYFKLFGLYEKLLEDTKGYNTTIYGKPRVVGQEVTIKLFHGQVFEVRLTPIHCAPKDNYDQINARLNFIGDDLLGEPELVGSLLLRGRGNDIYCEKSQKSLGQLDDPYTINFISGWLLNTTIEHMEST